MEPDRLNQHVLRTALLEGSSCDTILRNVRQFVAAGKSEEKKAELRSAVRKELTARVRELGSDEILNKFLDDLTSQVELDK